MIIIIIIILIIFKIMMIIIIITILIIFSPRCSTRRQRCRRPAWLPPVQPSPPPFLNPPLRYFLPVFACLYFPLFCFVFLSHYIFIIFIFLAASSRPSEQEVPSSPKVAAVHPETHPARAGKPQDIQ